MKLFRTIVVDPPWPYQNSGGLTGLKAHKKFRADGSVAKGVSAAAVYPLMKMEQLFALPVEGLTTPRAHLYLWTTNSFMAEAYQLAEAWGFTPKTIITWVKVKQDDRATPSMKMGFWYRSATEHVLFATKGKAMRLLGPPVSTAFLHPRPPQGSHSKKPSRFYKMVAAQSPGPFLELFARRRRKGWDRWGNEVESTVTL